MVEFYLGFSISSFQTEGYYDSQDWYYFIKNKKLPEIENANELWEKYEEIIPILKDLNVNSFRFSVDWARIYPEKDKINYKNLKRYMIFTKKLIDNNIEPFITLWHYVNPLWFFNLGGWENEENIYYFIDFSETIINNFSSIGVKYFISFNEPWVYILSSYISGKWPPFKKIKSISDLSVALNVLNNIMKANKEIYKIAKEKDVYLIYTENLSFVKLPLFSLFKAFILNNIRLIFPEEADFYGINYYGIYENEEKSEKRKAKFNVSMLKKVLDILDKPVFITENGINTEDEYLRVRLIKRYLYFFVKNRKKYNIKGYFIWSLMDNYEWDYGYNAKFGILNRNLSKKDSYYEIKDLFYKLNKKLNIS
ncbi:MAG: family 1 glycosylhydrolase [Nanopusillaceae archaeon]|jgi:beta-glucosidase